MVKVGQILQFLREMRKSNSENRSDPSIPGKDEGEKSDGESWSDPSVPGKDEEEKEVMVKADPSSLPCCEHISCWANRAAHGQREQNTHP